MQTQNFYAQQIVNVADMMQLQSVPQGAIKDILVSLSAKGVINGIGVVPTNPIPSLSVLIQTGKLILEDGSDVATPASTTLDLSGQLNGVVAGQSVYLAIFAIPTSVSDTPVVTPSGAIVNYRTYASVNYVVVAGLPAVAPVKPVTRPVGFEGVFIAFIHLSFGQSAITAANIDSTQMESFTNIPEILALIANTAGLHHTHPISDVTGLQTALNELQRIGAMIPESQVTNLLADLANLGTEIGTVNASLLAAIAIARAANIPETQVTNLVADLLAHTNAIGSINGSVATLTGGLATANTEITTLTGEVASLIFPNHMPDGYQKLPGGLIIQWKQGATVNAPNDTQMIQWPNPFLVCLSAQVSMKTDVSGTIVTRTYAINTFDANAITVVLTRRGDDGGYNTTPIVFGIGY